MSAAPAPSPSASPRAKSNAAQEVANLRLPVPFFDLLMVLLVTCLVFVAPLPKPGDVQALDISIAHGKAASSSDALLPVIPRRSGAGWTYEIAGEGSLIAPEALARRARDEARKIVLVVPPATALQDFIDMQTAMTAMNVPFALAIKSKETPQ